MFDSIKDVYLRHIHTNKIYMVLEIHSYAYKNSVLKLIPLNYALESLEKDRKICNVDKENVKFILVDDSFSETWEKIDKESLDRVINIDFDLIHVNVRHKKERTDKKYVYEREE